MHNIILYYKTYKTRFFYKSIGDAENLLNECPSTKATRKQAQLLLTHHCEQTESRKPLISSLPTAQKKPGCKNKFHIWIDPCKKTDFEKKLFDISIRFLFTPFNSTHVFSSSVQTAAEVRGDATSVFYYNDWVRKKK